MKGIGRPGWEARRVWRGAGVGVLVAVMAMVARPGPTPAQAPRPGSAPPARSAPDAHRHRTPRDWRFAWPSGGNPVRGREAFVKLACHTCHEVRGEGFPAPSDRESIGPELSQMARTHGPEYFAESIINPGAQIEKGKGYAAADGSSRMPSYNDSMTVQDVADLVAYLRGLRPPPVPPVQRVPGRPAPAPRPSGGHPTH